MANTTSEAEPKAPIVRIRKKKTKKKKDVVHLPVRASRTTRYTSLTTPTNPQSKGRECCRTIFASCFKIPVCRTLCFRCILPRCYAGEGSDDDEGDARDEGYHSQNRRSSDITPPLVGGTSGAVGATGGAVEIEMTEVKTEAVTLVPPPRQSVNDYKKPPCVNGSPKHSSSDTEHEPLKESEVTYIEVENISLSGDPIYIPESNLLTEISEMVNLSGSDIVSKENAKATVEGGKQGSWYEDPGKIHVHDTPEKLGGESKNKVKETTVHKELDPSEYVECDRTFSDESQFYVNEDVLFRPAPDGDSGGSAATGQNDSAIGYANLEGTEEQDSGLLHSKISTQNTKTSPRSKDKKPHEYVNIPPNVTNVGGPEERDFVVTGMVKTSSSEFKQLLHKSNLRHSGKCYTPDKSFSVHQEKEEMTVHKGDKQTLIKKQSDPGKGSKVVIESVNKKTETGTKNKNVSDTDRTNLL